MSINTTYWKLAQETAKILGWEALLIYSQWQLETAHFTSNNFKKNNNIAGQTWNSKLHALSMRGTARPRGEGGYYIKYNSPVDGYVDFVQKNHRYDIVKSGKTPEAQADILAGCGWAVDPHYSDKLKSLIRANREALGIKEVKKVTPVQAAKNKETSLIDTLKKQGKPTDFNSRRKLAASKGIHNYAGTLDQNIKLLSLIQK